MLRNRIIFSLIYDSGYFMQSRNFRLQKVGDLRWLEKNYKFQEIAFSLDELIILNATRQDKNLLHFCDIIKKIRKDIFIPIAAGGGISQIEDAEMLFKNGADKIVLNTSLYEKRNLIKQLVKKYGSQSIIASVDYKNHENVNIVYIKDGSINTNIDLESYISNLCEMNVGEIYLNSIDRDGTAFGYDLDTANRIRNLSTIPIIIAGGAGNGNHLIDGLNCGISAVATANLFNFVGNALPNARIRLIENKYNIANWSK
jgi:cyclase